MKAETQAIPTRPAEPQVGERKMVRITPERIAGVVMDAYAPQRDQLRRAVAGIIRGDDALRQKA
ncbi:hypothetical protein [Phenylobacterium aquaticum]|uniref:hypothetical protein n=1 Tax=Phenylobacterium aquaticum TaxID=1763816 RepID=UPI001F5DEDF9|nr:hypothetical protein [Phenylobacterium aquaticum]MCI3132085.1 hypothetical protein [Phenylobacterium aquaticum]